MERWSDRYPFIQSSRLNEATLRHGWVLTRVPRRQDRHLESDQEVFVFDHISLLSAFSIGPILSGVSGPIPGYQGLYPTDLM